MLSTNKIQILPSRIVTRFFPIVALLLLMSLCALPALAQDKLPAPPALRTLYSVVYGRNGYQECHEESGECTGYNASKCVGVTFRINAKTVAGDYSMRIWTGKNKPVRIEAGFVPYPTGWFDIAEWRVTQAPHISGGIFTMETWPSLDFGVYATYDICGLVESQTIKMRFRARDNRENSPYRYGEKTGLITVTIR